MRYYLGIDGGGTKTLIRIMDHTLTTYDTLTIEGSNISSLGYKITEDILTSGIKKMLDKNNLSVENCLCLCMGAAGVDTPKEKQSVESILTGIGFNHVKVVNDTQIILSTVSEDNNGIAVIAGTGSIVYGIKNDRTARAGGWGYKLGDEGSAFWIGKQAIKYTLDAYDQLIESTEMMDGVLETFHLSDATGFIEKFYFETVEKERIANLAKLVDTYAEAGDSSALKIMENAARLLVDQVGAVHRKLFDANEKVMVILNGSVVLKSKSYQKFFKKHLRNLSTHLIAQPIKMDPSFGACFLAKESYDESVS